MFGLSFPFGTLFVNVAGSLLMGMLAELFLAKGGGSQELKLFLATGMLGGFTISSAFSLEPAIMWQRVITRLFPPTSPALFCFQLAPWSWA
jgi:fluoride exporter